MDEARRARWRADVRCLARHAAGRRAPARLHDARVEGRLRARCCHRRPARPRTRHRLVAGLERERRTLGGPRRRDEEAGVERDRGDRRRAFRRAAPRATGRHRPVWLGTLLRSARGVRGQGGERQTGRARRYRGARLPDRLRQPLPLPEARDQSGAPVDAAALGDAREDTVAAVARATTGPTTITLSYPAAQTIRSATLFVADAIPPFGDAEFAPVLEAELDGGWQRIADVPLANVPTTVAFATVTARHFRVVFRPNTAPKSAGLAAPAPGAVVGGIFPTGPKPTTIRVATLRLSAEARVHRFEAKAGFAAVPDFYALASDALAPEASSAARVIDLTARVAPDGSLDWTPPPGHWRIVRLGWSLIGTTNHPATAEATGLEVDKYRRRCGAPLHRPLSRHLPRRARRFGQRPRRARYGQHRSRRRELDAAHDRAVPRRCAATIRRLGCPR